jgi:ABC-type nitrate/sulfonate/bicarbonate transport system substrate-binding protein
LHRKVASAFTGFLGQEYDRRGLVLGRVNEIAGARREVVVKLLGVLIVTAILSAVHFAPATAQEKFRVASGGFSTAIHAVTWAAYEKKIFQKYGLDGEYLALESGTPAMQAMLANELQIVFTTGALAITANLQGADTTIIAGGINFIPNKLLVRPEIKRPEDLKGRRIAISRFGSASDYATEVALEKSASIRRTSPSSRSAAISLVMRR